MDRESSRHTGWNLPSCRWCFCCQWKLPAQRMEPPSHRATVLQHSLRPLKLLSSEFPLSFSKAQLNEGLGRLRSLLDLLLLPHVFFPSLDGKGVGRVHPTAEGSASSPL
jgi:hypothetical protein